MVYNTLNGILIAKLQRQAKATTTTTIQTTFALHSAVPMADHKFPFAVPLPPPLPPPSSASLWLEIDLLCTDKSIFYCFICHRLKYKKSSLFHIYCFAATRRAQLVLRLGSLQSTYFASFPSCCCCCCCCYYYYCKPIEREKVKSAKATAKAVNL